MFVVAYVYALRPSYFNMSLLHGVLINTIMSNQNTILREVMHHVAHVIGKLTIVLSQ